jgi:hypothetical protein
MKTISFLLATGALLSALPAQATIFWSNFDVGTVVNRTTAGGWPRIERNPLEPYDNGLARVGVDSSYFYDTTFEFTVNSSFVADRAIMALRHLPGFNFAQRIGFGVSERNDTTGVFTGLGSLQVQANGLRDAVYEIDSPFGTNNTNLPTTFDYRPISFTAGRTYRVRGAFAAAGGNVTGWMLSDTVAAPGTAFQVLRGGASGNGSTALGFQPTFALTDGGDLVPLPPTTGGVPEPESWALMILGFGLIGTSLRRQHGKARGVSQPVRG